MNARIKNTSDRVQAVPGFAAFGPGEIRTFTKEDAQTLKLNPYLAEVEDGDAEIPEGNDSAGKTRAKKVKA